MKYIRNIINQLSLCTFRISDSKCFFILSMLLICGVCKGVFFGSGILICDELLFSTTVLKENIHIYISFLNIAALFGVGVSALLLESFSIQPMYLILASSIISVIGCGIQFSLQFLNLLDIGMIYLPHIFLFGSRLCHGIFCGSFMFNSVVFFLKSSRFLEKDALCFVFNFGIFFGSLLNNFSFTKINSYQFNLVPGFWISLACLETIIICLFDRSSVNQLTDRQNKSKTNLFATLKNDLSNENSYALKTCLLFGCQQVLGLSALINYSDLIFKEMGGMTIDSWKYNVIFSLFSVVGCIIIHFVFGNMVSRINVLKIGSISIGILYFIMAILEVGYESLAFASFFLTLIGFVYSVSWGYVPWLLFINTWKIKKTTSLILYAIFVYWLVGYIVMELFILLGNIHLSIAFIKLSICSFSTLFFMNSLIK